MDEAWEQEQIGKLNDKLNSSIRITTDGTEGYIIEDGQVYLSIPEGTKIKCMTILLMGLDRIRRELKDLSATTSKSMEEKLKYLLYKQDRDIELHGYLPTIMSEEVSKA